VPEKTNVPDEALTEGDVSASPFYLLSFMFSCVAWF